MDIIIRIIQTRCFSAKRMQPILGHRLMMLQPDFQ